MKIQFPWGLQRRHGFTLPEIMIAVTILIMLVAGVVFANLFGLSMFRITSNTLDAADDTRKTIGRVISEIHTCNETWVGNVRGGVFETLTDGEKQEGTGLLIYPTQNTNNFIIYFVNPADRTFRRTTSAPGSSVVLIETVTNNIVFRAQNHRGVVMTNNMSQDNRVIRLTLEYYQVKRYRQLSDCYKFETSVAKRTKKLL